MNWSYHSGERGPEHWYTLCSEFKKAMDENPLQSPIALKTVYAQKETKKREVFEYHPEKLMFETSFYNNTIHLTPIEEGKQSTAFWNGKPFVLDDIHAHLPSEHTIDDKYFAIEVHFVHRSKEGEVLVIGVMLETLANEAKETDVEGYTHFFTEENLNHHHRLTIDIAQWLPRESDYFQYKGSLTSPPNTGPINWFIMKKPLTVPTGLVAGFEQSIGKTNRPIQPDLGRPVFLYEE